MKLPTTTTIALFAALIYSVAAAERGVRGVTEEYRLLGANSGNRGMEMRMKKSKHKSSRVMEKQRKSAKKKHKGRKEKCHKEKGEKEEKGEKGEKREKGEKGEKGSSHKEKGEKEAECSPDSDDDESSDDDDKRERDSEDVQKKDDDYDDDDDKKDDDDDEEDKDKGDDDNDEEDKKEDDDDEEDKKYDDDDEGDNKDDDDENNKDDDDEDEEDYLDEDNEDNGVDGDDEDDGDDIGNGEVGDEPLELISIGNERPEGIVAGSGPYMYTSEMAFGGVKKVNIKTGQTEQVVPSFNFLERGANGMDLIDGTLFVAGAGSPYVEPLLYVYDESTGVTLAVCEPDGDASFLNDVTVVGDYAYVTDSQINSIMEVDVQDAINGECTVSSIELPEDEFYSNDGEFRANGIIGYGSGLIISRTEPGGLYFLNLMDESVTQIASPDEAPSPDGLARSGGTLYVTQNALNRISVYQLEQDGSDVTADFRGTMSSPDYDFPTASAIFKDRIYSVNARMESLPFPATDEGTSNFEEVFTTNSVDRFSYKQGA